VSALRLSKELEKPGPKRILKDGGTYVLVWQADLNDRQRLAAEAALDAEAKKIVDAPRWRIWDASAILRLAERHPAVVEALELVEFGAVRGLQELEESLRVEDRPYEPDTERAAAIEQMRSRAGEATDDTTRSHCFRARRDRQDATRRGSSECRGPARHDPLCGFGRRSSYVRSAHR